MTINTATETIHATRKALRDSDRMLGDSEHFNEIQILRKCVSDLSDVCLYLLTSTIKPTKAISEVMSV